MIIAALIYACLWFVICKIVQAIEREKKIEEAKKKRGK